MARRRFWQAVGIGWIEFEELENDTAQGYKVLGGIPDVGLVVVSADAETNVPTDFVAVELRRLGLHHDQTAEVPPFSSYFSIHPVEAMVAIDTIFSAVQVLGDFSTKRQALSHRRARMNPRQRGLDGFLCCLLVVV